jgi:hypothetical protein
MNLTCEKHTILKQVDPEPFQPLFPQSEFFGIYFLFTFINHFKTPLLNVFKFFFHGAAAPSGPEPPHYRGFTITFI